MKPYPSPAFFRGFSSSSWYTLRQAKGFTVEMENVLYLELFFPASVFFFGSDLAVKTLISPPPLSLFKEGDSDP